MSKFTTENNPTEENNIDVVCPHCGKSGNKPAMKRWHFDKCKANPNRAQKASPTIDQIISPKPVRKKTRETDMSHDPTYCDFIPGSYFWHCAMARRGVEPQCSVSRLLIGTKAAIHSLPKSLPPPTMLNTSV